MGGILKVAAVWQSDIGVGGTEGAHTCGGGAAGALGSNVDVIFSVGVQTRDGIRKSSDNVGCAAAGSEAVKTILNAPRCGIAVLGPSDTEVVAVETSQRDIRHRRTIGHRLDGDIVNEEVVGGGFRSTVESHSDAVTSTSIAAQVGSLESVDVARDRHGVDGYKSRLVGSVGDDTHLDEAGGRCRVHSYPERQLQCVHRINSRVNRRQDSDIPVAVSTCGRG